MTIWIDAQLPPSIAIWITETLGVKAIAVRDLDLHFASDRVIFNAARKESAIVMTKDADFADLQQQFGVPPKIIWLTCGNTSNDHLKSILKQTLEKALELLEKGEILVEIKDQ